MGGGGGGREEFDIFHDCISVLEYSNIHQKIFLKEIKPNSLLKIALVPYINIFLRSSHE